MQTHDGLVNLHTHNALSVGYSHIHHGPVKVENLLMDWLEYTFT